MTRFERATLNMIGLGAVVAIGMTAMYPTADAVGDCFMMILMMWVLRFQLNVRKTLKAQTLSNERAIAAFHEYADAHLAELRERAKGAKSS